tara:strand:+ start:132 stop:377 length:246 start_codon:yes stop_codon:yes gene_type:complete
MNRVRAIREHKRVGRGSCTYVDECWSDKDILAFLDKDGVTTAQGAVDWAIDSEGLIRDQGASCTSGEKDCPLVRAAEEWRT